MSLAMEPLIDLVADGINHSPQELGGRLANLTAGGDWVSLHRYLGTDQATADGMVSTNGTSELPMRNQFVTWRKFMIDSAPADTTLAKEPSHAVA